MRKSEATSLPKLQRQRQQLRQQLLQSLPQTRWRNFLSWFKGSETILVARATVFTGFVTAVIGAMDWSPLLGLDMSTGFNQKQVMWLGGVMVAQGIGVELARRNKSDL